MAIPICDAVIRILTLMRQLLVECGVQSEVCVCVCVMCVVCVAMSCTAFYALSALYGRNMLNLALAINKPSIFKIQQKTVVKS